MTKSIFSILSLSLTLLAFAPGARAADKPSDQMKSSLKQACQSDIQKYCSDVKENRIMSCLYSHDDKLSSTCNTQWQQARTEWKNTMKGMHQACAGDVQKFCSNADNPKDVQSCLSDHQTDLTTACRDFRSKNSMG